MSAIENISNTRGATVESLSGASHEQLEGEDVKGAFLALLQGLVGFSGAVQNQELPDVRLPAVEQKAEVVEQKVEQTSKPEVRAQQEQETTQEKTTTEAKVVTQNQKENVQETTEQKEKAQIAPQEKTQTTQKEVVTQDKQVEQQVKHVEQQVKQVVENTETAVKDQAVQILNKDAVQVEKQVVETVARQVKARKEGPVQNQEAVKQVNERAQVTFSDPTTDYTPLSDQIEVEHVSQKVQKSVKSGASAETFDPEELYARQEMEQLFGLPAPKKDTLIKAQPLEATVKPEQAAKAKDSSQHLLFAQLMLGRGATDDASQMIRQFSKATAVDSTLSLDNKTESKKESHAAGKSSFVKPGSLQEAFVKKVKEVMERAAMMKSGQEISVKVNPPHLGEVRVQVSHKEGTITARITSEHKDVEQVLRNRSSELNLVLQALGFRAEDVEVLIGRETPSEHGFSEELAHDAQTNQGSAEGQTEGEGGKNSFSSVLEEDGQEAEIVTQEENPDSAGWVA